MKQFALPEATEIHLVKAEFKPRKNGKKKVPSARLYVRARLANLFLDQLWPDLRRAMYEAASGSEQQRDLEGVEQVSDTPRLRFQNMKPLASKDELTGYSAKILVGIQHPEGSVDLTGCTLDKFEADLKQGGAVELGFRISSEGLKERDIGRLGMMVDADVALILKPPTIQDPLTMVEVPPGKEPENTKADVAEDTRHRKAGKESGVSRIQKKITAAAKKGSRKATPTATKKRVRKPTPKAAK